MKKILLLLCILILIQVEGKSMINFHKDGKLMWLIDTTEVGIMSDLSEM